VVRHIRHKHPTVACTAGVSKLDAASAAATLADYVNTWARKKFVLHSSRRRARRPSEPPPPPPPPPPRDAATSDDSRPSSSWRCGVSPSAIGDVRSAASRVVVVGGESLASSEDRLVIDVGSEELDDSCAAVERDQRDAVQPASD